jgi:hypothetical protein
MFDKELKRLNDNIETTKVQAGIIRDRVVGHVRRNRKTYIGIVVSGVVSGTAGVILSRGDSVTVSPKIQQILNYKSPSTNTINNVYYGDPGNHVRCVETGGTWLSQGAAARANGINPSYMSKHLKGQMESCKDLHFELTGDHGLEIVKPAA